MTKLTTYRCDICGMDFDNEAECLCHEVNHKLDDIFDTEETKFYANGNRLIKNKYEGANDFLSKVDAIEVTNSEAARAINQFYDEKKFLKPFMDIDSRRVYFDDYNGDWRDADVDTKNIKAKFGE